MARILVVDDDASIRELLFFLLGKQEGHAVITVEHGGLAYQELLTCCIQGINFDLVITDTNMPIIDGIGLIQIIRKTDLPFGNVPIILTSGLVTDNLMTQGLRAGANLVIAKPFDVDALLRAVARVM